MSIGWRLAWTTASDDTRDEFVELARQGEALLVALGGARPFPAASNLNNSTGGDTFSNWTDQYDSANTAIGGRSMPLGVMFAGVSGWDLRSDAVLQRFLSATPPTWNVIAQNISRKVVPAGVRPLFDWWMSRSPGLSTGNDPQQYQDRSARGWWDQFVTALPAAPAPTPPTTDTNSSSSGNMLFAAVAIGLYALLRRRRRGRR